MAAPGRERLVVSPTYHSFFIFSLNTPFTQSAEIKISSIPERCVQLLATYTSKVACVVKKKFGLNIHPLRPNDRSRMFTY
jgi:hypothetical protein